MPLLQQLIHNGVVVPEPPAPLGRTIVVRGEELRLTPVQEEMALAWARKKDTPYVQDEVFVANFMRDFSAALGIEPSLSLDEVDFAAFYAFVDQEREIKAGMTKEQRKALAAQRKAVREALKARYGFAIVNGQRVELGTYMVEPSGIFMGRGQHPLRGRWKEGAQESDITLNLSPDASPLEGSQATIVWQPESLWVARWKDKLSGKLKYIWLADTAPVKQEREALKFDKAAALDDKMDMVRARIEGGLGDPDPRRRMIATACYLIDVLCLRVGDEKDADEADTVGATTLRPEHVRLREDGRVEFKFLGKDSVEWHKTLEPPRIVWDNLAALARNARPAESGSNGEANHPAQGLPQLFPDITSRDVNAYLSSVVPGLTAKVFRTHHATKVVRESLAESGLRPEHPGYMKWKAANLANFEAAVLCNHTKQYKGDWQRTRERYKQRQLRAEERLERYRGQIQELLAKRKQLEQESREKVAAAKIPERRQKTRERYQKRIASAQRRLEAARQRRARAQNALGKIKAQLMIAGKKRTWNLGTSLKSYIDPRVYHDWGKEVDYAVLERYYPATLRRKFAWVRHLGDGQESLTEGGPVTLRTCMSSDLPAVARLFESVHREHPEAGLPLEAEAIGERHLPSLEKDWREAIIALDEQEKVVGFVALGPEWTDEGRALLDVFGLLHPAWRSPALARLLANELNRSFAAYRMHHPRKRFELGPRHDDWYTYTPEMVKALGLEESDVDRETEGAGEAASQDGPLLALGE